MNTEELDRLEALEKAATRGPWQVYIELGIQSRIFSTDEAEDRALELGITKPSEGPSLSQYTYELKDLAEKDEWIKKANEGGASVCAEHPEITIVARGGYTAKDSPPPSESGAPDPTA